MVTYTKHQLRKKEASKRLRGERDQIKFIDLRFDNNDNANEHQLLSHNLVFLFRLISIGKLTSIPLLNVHLKSSILSTEAAGFSHPVTY